jgi:hypothetical protein
MKGCTFRFRCAPALAVATILVIGACAPRPAPLPKILTVAVWPFEDNSPTNERLAPSTLSLFADIAIEAVMAEPGVDAVVERARLEEILRELQIGSSEVADQSTRLRVGRILGARWMVFCAWLRPKADCPGRLDVKIFEVETGAQLAEEEQVFSGKTSDLEIAVRETVRQVVAQALEHRPPPGH